MGPVGVWKGQLSNSFLLSYTMGRSSHLHTPAPERFALQDNRVLSFLANKRLHHGKLENSFSLLSFQFILFYPQDPQFLCHEIH